MQSVRRTLLALSLLICSLAIAQDSSPQPQPTRKILNGTITGTVFCADTHKPARGALVLLDPVPEANEKKSRATGAAGFARVAFDGTYTLEDVYPGEYVLSAALPGYLAPFEILIAADANEDAEKTDDKSSPRDRRLNLRPGKTETVHMTLERGAAISGRILYPDGSPAIQLVVIPEDLNAPTSENRSVGIDQVTRSMAIYPTPITDDLGRFRISGIAPGTYRIVANLSTSEPMALYPGMFAYGKLLRIYSGDTLHRNDAKKYELNAGDEITGVEIALPTATFHSVQGLLTAKDGRPITHATVTLTDVKDDTLTVYGDIEHDGTFRFSMVPVGTYTLKATDAEIGKLPDNLPPIASTRYVALKTTNTFADGSTSVIVKDSDVPNVTLTLTENPHSK